MQSIAERLVRHLRDQGILGQILRFAIVGGLAFLLDAAILKTLVHFGVDPVVGRIFSLAASVTLTWVLNRNLTFAAQKPPSWGEFGHYVLSSMMGLIINYVVYSAAVFLHTPLIVALVIGTVIASIFNFFRYRQLLSDKKPSGAAPP